ncbi:hypothetical protein NMY22_g474 [Coprinellus aureogranulatus]|nr:hypothetical protein NMY22_g474 [Coprinellus aureogranulatus]
MLDTELNIHPPIVLTSCPRGHLERTASSSIVVPICNRSVQVWVTGSPASVSSPSLSNSPLRPTRKKKALEPTIINLSLEHRRTTLIWEGWVRTDRELTAQYAVSNLVEEGRYHLTSCFLSSSSPVAFVIDASFYAERTPAVPKEREIKRSLRCRRSAEENLFWLLISSFIALLPYFPSVLDFARPSRFPNPRAHPFLHQSSQLQPLAASPYPHERTLFSALPTKITWNQCIPGSDISSQAREAELRTRIELCLRTSTSRDPLHLSVSAPLPPRALGPRRSTLST